MANCGNSKMQRIKFVKPIMQTYSGKQMTMLTNSAIVKGIAVAQYAANTSATTHTFNTRPIMAGHTLTALTTYHIRTMCVHLKTASLMAWTNRRLHERSLSQDHTTAEPCMTIV